MFLNYFKNLYLKYILKNKWQELSDPVESHTIQTVGLLIDTTTFSEKERLVQHLIANGFVEQNISVLVYSDAAPKKEIGAGMTFNSGVINWSGNSTNAKVNQFINTKFDVLISYYEIEKPTLLLITNRSKAYFKIGFAAVDKRFNHLMVSSSLDQYALFTQEVVKYLKILNKIKR